MLRARTHADYERHFRTMQDWKADALLIGAAAPFFGDADRLTHLALEARLPTVCEWAEMAALGCTLGYGPSRPRLYGAASRKLIQVLRGQAPGDIPIERPEAFSFAINVKLARTLGVDLPPTIYARADELIE